MAEGRLPAGSQPGPGGQPLDHRAAGETAPSDAETAALWRDNLYCVSVPPAGRRRLYRIHSQLFIKLDFDLDLPQAGRRGDDMVLRFDNGSEVVFEGFLGIADRDPTLHLLPPDGSLLPGDTVAAGLGALPGPPPALKTERPGAAGPLVLEDRAAAPEDTPSVEQAPGWPTQEILDDLQAKGLPVAAADPAETVAPDEPPVSAADLVSQVAEALPEFQPGPEPQPETLQPGPEEAEPQEPEATEPAAAEAAPDAFAPPPEAPAVETEPPLAAAAPPQDGTVWADALPHPDSLPEPEAPEPQPDASVQEAPVEQAAAQDAWMPENEAEEGSAEDFPAQEAPPQEAPPQEAPPQEAPVQEAQTQDLLDQAADPPQADPQPAPPAPADTGLGDDVRFLPEQSLEDLLPPELLGQEPLPEALPEAPPPAAPGAEAPCAPAEAVPETLPPADPAAWVSDPEPQQAPPALPSQDPVPQVPLAPEPPSQAVPALEPAPQPPEPLPPEPLPLEPLPLEALAAELAPQAAAEAVWAEPQPWPAAPQNTPPPLPEEAPPPEAPQAEAAQPDLPPEAPAAPSAPPEILAESWDPAAETEAAPLPEPIQDSMLPAPALPPEAQGDVEPPSEPPIVPPVEAEWEAAQMPVPEPLPVPQPPAEIPPPALPEATTPMAEAVPASQGGLYPAAEPFAPAEGHWQVEPDLAEAPAPAAAPAAPFEDAPVAPLPPAPEDFAAPDESAAAPEDAAPGPAEPEALPADPAPALPDPEMVVKATQILAAFEQLSAASGLAGAEPLPEAPELFAEAAQTVDPVPEDTEPAAFAPVEPEPAENAVADPLPATAPQTDEALPAAPAVAEEAPAAASDAAAPRPDPEAEAPQSPGGGLLRSAVANVMRARSLILPGRGPVAEAEAEKEEEETLPADSAADGPQEGVLELTDSYEEPMPAEPAAPARPEAGEARAPDMNAMDLFADPLGEDLPDLSDVPVGEELPPKVPSFLTEPGPIGPARRRGGPVKDIPAEVRDAVLVALHQMEEEDLFDFDGEARPPEAEAGQMVAVPIEGAAQPVGVIFAGENAPDAPGDPEGEALPGAGESGQLPD